MSGFLLVFAVILAAVSASAWVIEAMPFVNAVKDVVQSTKFLNHKNWVVQLIYVVPNTFIAITVVLRMIICLPKAIPFALDLTATYLCIQLFGMSMSTLGVVMGLAISDVISAGIIINTIKGRRERRDRALCAKLA